MLGRVGVEVGGLEVYLAQGTVRDPSDPYPAPSFLEEVQSLLGGAPAPTPPLSPPDRPGLGLPSFFVCTSRGPDSLGFLLRAQRLPSFLPTCYPVPKLGLGSS